jgi:hypothetical protein
LPIQLLPADFEQDAVAAIRAFWVSRTSGGGGAQGGTRDAVISGKNMDGFIELVRKVAVHAGLPQGCVKTRRSEVILPGYFRATKNWDVLVIHRRRLIAVFEFKSQVGSFGNNFNNRSEEVIGAAADLWVAHRHGAYQEGGPSGDASVTLLREGSPLLHPDLQRDPRPPFLAWLMLLEECPGSTRPVGVDEPNYRVLPEFRGASYAERYQLLCERLVERRLYGAAALVLSQQENGATTGAHRALSPATSLRALFSEFAARASVAASEG